MPNWTQVASGSSSSDAPSIPLDTDNYAYLLVIDSPVDIPHGVVGAIQAALSAATVPIAVRQTASNEIQIQIGDA